MLLAVVLGKQIIRDDWIVESAGQKQLLDAANFVLNDPKFEEKWGRALDDIYEHPLTDLLAGMTLFITPSLKKEYGTGFKDIEKIATAAGATKVLSRQVKDVNGVVGKGGSVDDVVVMAADDDEQAELLIEAGVVCYVKDLLSSSIFAGTLNTDVEDMKWAPKSKPKPKQKRLNRIGK